MSLLGRLRGMVGRAVLALVDDAKTMQAVQVTTQADRVTDEAEHFQHYGFTSVPLPGAEGIALAVGGSQDHLLVINVDDRRYRMKALANGEVALYDHLGQSVHLTKSGIVVKGAGLPIVVEDTPSITFKAANLVRFETPRFEVTGLTITQNLTVGLTGAGTATMNGGTLNFSGVNLNYDGCVVTYNGGSITHDGRNVGGTHNHPETGGTTLEPNA